jgi:Fatty acid hydroxylase superfamily
MALSTDLREIAIRHGQAKKWTNAVAAVLCGIAPALLLALHASLTWQRWLLGLSIGLLWGNAFEYAYHRFLLHRPRTQHGAAHQEHHAQIGTSQEAEFVALISSPVNIVLLFLINGIPALLISFLLGLQGILCGVFIGWSLYVILCEEIHWRIHLNGWLPPGLQFARAYHMSHHDIPNSRYNVFFPLFDFLLGNLEVGKTKLSA